MILELSAFQSKAIKDLHGRIVIAHENYRKHHIPQIISLQAPTGSGKTIMLASLIEDIYLGTEDFPEQPDAIFVWLSDSPALNEQSKQKIERKADRIRLNQCITVSDENFNQKIFDDGRIYFLNTQKIGKSGNLGKHSDMRQYTIWEMIENTAREKPEKLYFVIDEAHRGMQGRAAGIATTIMQRFIKGSSEYGLSPVPVIIGISATAERFNTLAGNTESTLQKVIVNPADVRSSGLLKDRIILNYPQDSSRQNDMAVLHAAADEWHDKCIHWKQYTDEQHEKDIKPIFVVQVSAGSGGSVSGVNLDDVIAKIEERLGESFKENEVVHTFGSTGTLTLNGLNVHHVEPDAITDDMRIRVVLFKENLSTGWDCPRAETMMSFRHAEDATYIAQLLGRMIRTPLQRHVMADDSLNEVRLFLPYFDRETVQGIVDGLQNAEGGDIPAVVEEEQLGSGLYTTWTTNTRQNTGNKTLPGQILIGLDEHPHIILPAIQDAAPLHARQNKQHTEKKTDTQTEQISIPGLYIDRRAVMKFINEQGYLTYTVRSARINSYLKSLLNLSGILTQYGIYPQSDNDIKREVTDMIRKYIEMLHKEHKYDSLAKHILEFRLSSKVLNALGDAISNFHTRDIISLSDTDLDRQLREADAKMCGYGFPNIYGRRFMDSEHPDEYKIDCILFAKDEYCMTQLNEYAEKKFHELDDRYRIYIVHKSENCRNQYDTVIRDGDCVSKHNFRLPETYRARVDVGGKVYTNHLFADKNGNAQISLNGWEAGVLEEEIGRNDFVCWLRNPPRQTWSLCVPYTMDGEKKALYPDFLIVRSDSQLGYMMDILEPHNPDWKDNLGKAKGLAEYARQESKIGRVQLIRKKKDAAGRDKFLRLDMSKGSVRSKVLSAVNNDDLDNIFNMLGEFINQ